MSEIELKPLYDLGKSKCPLCNAPFNIREKRPNGYTYCERGHSFAHDVWDRQNGYEPVDKYKELQTATEQLQTHLNLAVTALGRASTATTGGMRAYIEETILEIKGEI